MEGGYVSQCGSRLSAAQTHLESVQKFPGFVWLESLEWCLGTRQDCQNAAVTSICLAEVPGS
eukprot:676182-Pyramimonas_sp.AAC.1